MELDKVLFWNVDTQVDFIEPTGKLYAPGAEEIRPILGKITSYAKDNRIKVVNTADHHKITSEELSSHPDYIDSFPQHCMAGSKGAAFVEETNPDNPLILEWDKEYVLHEDFFDAGKHRNILIRKDSFDVFEGNPNTENFLSLINPERIFVYGVTTNVCVDYAVVGLAERGYEVFVIEDGIKELPNIPLPFDKWTELGVKMIKFEDIVNYL
ncbi:cysteine hydrolase [Puteibacter caeruleilacunae]|nr:cysteine hydrolase [Puteibacter caeruleilacunae]